MIIDVLTDDPSCAEWSIAQLESYSGSGLVINPVVYAELCYGCPSTEFVDDVVRKFGLTYQENEQPLRQMLSAVAIDELVAAA